MRCLVWLLLVLGLACGVGDGRAAVVTFLGGTSVQEFATTVTRASGGWRYAGYDPYAAYGTRVQEASAGGVSADRFRANSREEDPTGLLNEGFRYRDLETGTFISRDPLGFVDGPNVYCYVGQNPWSAFDPEGLRLSATGVTFDETESGDIAVNVRHAAGTLDRGGLMFDSHEERGAGMWTYMTLKRSTMESGHANGQLEHMRRAAIVQFDNWQNQYYEGGADAAKLGLINAMDFTGAGDAAYNGKSALEVAARIGVGGLSVAFGGAALGAMRGTYAAGSAAGAMGLASAGSDLVLQGGLGVVDAISGNEVKPYSWTQTAGAFLGGAVVGKLAGGLGAARSGGRIFYVGEGAETLARKIASETGYKTIYNTWYGKIGEKVTPYLLTSPRHRLHLML